MELRQLAYLVAVAEEANFTRAAERVHISQPGISAQIRQLENDLGATLIDRSGRTATLTPAGEAAVVHARAALAAAESVRRAVDEVNGLIRGRLAVGMVTACTVTPLFNALSTFHASFPGVDITVTEDNSDRLIEHTLCGKVDFALVGSAGRPPSGLHALQLVSERLTAIVPSGHALAARARTTLEEVSAYPIVCLPVGTGIRSVFDQACTTMGLRPAIALQASAPGAVADLAARGLGVAVLSESMAAQDSRLVSVPIGDIETPAVLALVWTATGNPALREFLVHCQRAFAASHQRPASVTGGRPRAPRLRAGAEAASDAQSSASSMRAARRQ